MCGIVEYIGYREAHLHETVFATPVWGIYATLPVRRLSRFAPIIGRWPSSTPAQKQDGSTTRRHTEIRESASGSDCYFSNKGSWIIRRRNEIVRRGFKRLVKRCTLAIKHLALFSVESQ